MSVGLGYIMKEGNIRNVKLQAILCLYQTNNNKLFTVSHEIMLINYTVSSSARTQPFT